jgi:hypothetical protein
MEKITQCNILHKLIGAWAFWGVKNIEVIISK